MHVLGSCLKMLGVARRGKTRAVYVHSDGISTCGVDLCKLPIPLPDAYGDNFIVLKACSDILRLPLV